MTTSQKSTSKIASHRLVQQHIAAPDFETPADVLRWLGPVQAQDYLGSLWAVGLRMQTATEAVVEDGHADRSIVRSWPMRGTLHFVPAENVRWMLKLLTQRVMARSQTRFRQMELDEKVFSRSEKVIIRALSGGRQLSRPAVYKELEAAGIATRNVRGLHIISKLAQDGVICFGPRQGKQPTFVLLEEWVPAVKPKRRGRGVGGSYQAVLRRTWSGYAAGFRMVVGIIEFGRPRGAGNGKVMAGIRNDRWSVLLVFSYDARGNFTCKERVSPTGVRRVYGCVQRS